MQCPGGARSPCSSLRGSLGSGTVHCGMAVGGGVVPRGSVTVAKLIRILTGEASGCSGSVKIAAWPLETVVTVAELMVL